MESRLVWASHNAGQAFQRAWAQAVQGRPLGPKLPPGPSQIDLWGVMSKKQLTFADSVHLQSCHSSSGTLQILSPEEQQVH